MVATQGPVLLSGEGYGEDGGRPALPEVFAALQKARTRLADAQRGLQEARAMGPGLHLTRANTAVEQAAHQVIAAETGVQAHQEARAEAHTRTMLDEARRTTLAAERAADASERQAAALEHVEAVLIKLVALLRDAT